MKIEIRIDKLSSEESQSIVREHMAGMLASTPTESVHALPLDKLRQPNITFWTAWIGSELCGCGALQAHDVQHGEVKPFEDGQYSDERASIKSNQLWSKMESVANKVGDDVRSFWIAPHDVALENFSLEIFAGGWIKLISNGSVSDADLETLKLIYSLMESSKSKCLELGFPAHHVQSPKISETEAFLIILKKLLGETVSI